MNGGAGNDSIRNSASAIISGGEGADSLINTNLGENSTINGDAGDDYIYGGLKYLKQQLDRFGGDFDKASAAYNAGAGAVEKYGGVPPYGETKRYVARIKGFLESAPQYNGENYSYKKTQPDLESIFGVESYNMSTQSGMISRVDKLKPGWEKVIPQIGGVLKNKFGVNPVISSAARTPSHNAAVNGAKNSYHLIRENGGDALDIVFDGTNEQKNQIENYFKQSGLFKEVLYHDAGSGYHLHLGGLNTDALADAKSQKVGSSGKSANDPNFTERQEDSDIAAEESEELEGENTSFVDSVIESLLGKNVEPNFKIDRADTALTKEVYKKFAFRKRFDEEGYPREENKQFFEENNFFDNDGVYKPTPINNRILENHFGKQEIDDFGQKHVAERLAAIKNIQTPNSDFIDDEYFSKKTGITIFESKLADELSKEDADEISKIAYEYGGRPNKKGNIFSFEDADSRAAFKKEVINILRAEKEIPPLTETLPPLNLKDFDELAKATDEGTINILSDKWQNNSVIANYFKDFVEQKYKDPKAEYREELEDITKDGKFVDTLENRRTVNAFYSEELLPFVIDEFNRQYEERQRLQEQAAQEQLQNDVNTLQNNLQELQTKTDAAQAKLQDAMDKKDAAAIKKYGAELETLGEQTRNTYAQLEQFNIPPAENEFTPPLVETLPQENISVPPVETETPNQELTQEEIDELFNSVTEGLSQEEIDKLLAVESISPAETLPQENISMPPAETLPQENISVPPAETLSQENITAPPVETLPQENITAPPVKTLPQENITAPPAETLSQENITAPPAETLPQENIAAPPVETQPAKNFESRDTSTTFESVLKTNLPQNVFSAVKKIAKDYGATFGRNKKNTFKFEDAESRAAFEEYADNYIENSKPQSDSKSKVDEKTIDFELGARTLLKNAKLENLKLPHSDFTDIAFPEVNPVTNGGQNETFVEFSQRFPNKTILATFKKLAEKSNGQTTKEDSANSKFFFETFEDAMNFAKASELLLNNGKPLLDVRKAEREQARFEKYDLQKIREEFEIKKAAKEKLGEPREDFDGEGVDTGTEKYLYDDNSHSYYNAETRKGVTMGTAKEYALMYLHDYGNAEKAIAGIDYDLKYEPVGGFEKQLNGAKEILRGEGKNWKPIYLERVLKVETEENFAESYDEEENETLPPSKIQTPNTNFEFFKKNVKLMPEQLKALEKTMREPVTHNGEEMTRQEFIEKIARGEIEEPEGEITAGENIYLDFLRGRKNPPVQNDSLKETESSSVHFILGEQENTKTGKLMPSAELSEKVSNEDFVRLNEFAKMRGGAYSKVAQKFLFKTAKGRDSFVEEASRNILKTAPAETSATVQKSTPPKTETAAPAETKQPAKRKPTGIFGTLEESEKELKEAFGVVDEEKTTAPAENESAAQTPTPPKTETAAPSKTKSSQAETVEKNNAAASTNKKSRVIPKDKFVNVIDDSDEALARYVAEWKAEIKKMSATPMFNPKLWTAGIKIGLVYIQRGINNFADWAKQITDTLGEESKIWQPAIFEMLETMPQIKKFNDKQITSIAKRIGILYNNGTTDFEEIRADFIKNIDGENTNKIEPMIKATYNGVKKFFETLDAENKKLNPSRKNGHKKAEKKQVNT